MTIDSHSPEPEELLAQAMRGHPAAWAAIIDELGPLVRGYLRAVGDPDPDAELDSTITELAQDLDSYGADADEFVMVLFAVTVGRQRTIRRALPGAPAVTPYSAPGLHLDPDARDAVLLARVAGLDSAQIALILDLSPEEVEAIQVQGAAQIADDEWGAR